MSEILTLPPKLPNLRMLRLEQVNFVPDADTV